MIMNWQLIIKYQIPWGLFTAWFTITRNEKNFGYIESFMFLCWKALWIMHRDCIKLGKYYISHCVPLWNNHPGIDIENRQ